MIGILKLNFCKYISELVGKFIPYRLYKGHLYVIKLVFSFLFIIFQFAAITDQVRPISQVPSVRRSERANRNARITIQHPIKMQQSQDVV